MGLPKGFQFSGTACGIKPSGGLDLAVISTDHSSVAAGVYTQNVVRAASIDWNRNLTPSESFRALVINSGNANACTGDQGLVDNQEMASEVAGILHVSPDQVLVLSTGVIGHHLPMEQVRIGIHDAMSLRSDSQDRFDSASTAILTTDKGTKTVQKTIQIGEVEVNIAGMAKGAGMIGPNMATMLAVIMTDVKISASDAQQVLSKAAEQSFNRISVEGHTSTNDALLLICSGASGAEVQSESDFARFADELTWSCVELAKRIPSDGEGASHLVTIKVQGAQSEEDADRVARTVAASALVKTAITGADPNWGRIVSAAGYAGVPMKVEQTNLKLNGHVVFENGRPVKFDAVAVSQSMSSQFETLIDLRIGTGPGVATHWTSDLTVDYVRFNSEYTT
jgi:glutamate N-acetyltransferase/amino-acid N-acetyltransferase